MVRSETIELITLDDWCTDNDFDKVDLVKLDTQGSELDILRGAERALAVRLDRAGGGRVQPHVRRPTALRRRRPVPPRTGLRPLAARQPEPPPSARRPSRLTTCVPDLRLRRRAVHRPLGTAVLGGCRVRAHRPRDARSRGRLEDRAAPGVPGERAGAQRADGAGPRCARPGAARRDPRGRRGGARAAPAARQRDRATHGHRRPGPSVVAAVGDRGRPAPRSTARRRARGAGRGHRVARAPTLHRPSRSASPVPAGGRGSTCRSGCRPRPAWSSSSCRTTSGCATTSCWRSTACR